MEIILNYKLITIFILPLFSVIIISLLLIKEDPQGESRLTNFSNLKFCEYDFEANTKKRIKTYIIFFTL